MKKRLHSSYTGATTNNFGLVRMQRVAYKKFKAGEKSTMTVEKALKLTEVGFCFDASARFK